MRKIPRTIKLTVAIVALLAPQRWGWPPPSSAISPARDTSAEVMSTRLLEPATVRSADTSVGL